VHLKLSHVAEEAHLWPRSVLSFRSKNTEQYATHEARPFRLFQSQVFSTNW
jgi:hypothetical protein